MIRWYSNWFYSVPLCGVKYIHNMKSSNNTVKSHIVITSSRKQFILIVSIVINIHSVDFKVSSVGFSLGSLVQSLFRPRQC